MSNDDDTLSGFAKVDSYAHVDGEEPDHAIAEPTDAPVREIVAALPDHVIEPTADQVVLSQLPTEYSHQEIADAAQSANGKSAPADEIGALRKEVDALNDRAAVLENQIADILAKQPAAVDPDEAGAIAEHPLTNEHVSFIEKLMTHFAGKV